MIEITTEDALVVEDDVRREALMERQCTDQLCIVDYVEVSLPEPRDAAPAAPQRPFRSWPELPELVTNQPRGPP